MYIWGDIPSEGEIEWSDISSSEGIQCDDISSSEGIQCDDISSSEGIQNEMGTRFRLTWKRSSITSNSGV
jgi:hypothetical protein